jgi:hypothetical protein
MSLNNAHNRFYFLYKNQMRLGALFRDVLLVYDFAFNFALHFDFCIKKQNQKFGFGFLILQSKIKCQCQQKS